MSFREELERRNVFRVGVAYVIVAWVVAQAVDVLTNPLHLPDWLDTVVIVLLAAGFPVALVLAWAYEVTPTGIKRTRLVPSASSMRRISGQKLNYAVTGLLAFAVVFMAADVYVLTPEHALGRSGAAALMTPAHSATSIAAAEASFGDPPAPVARRGSIAILPFEDLSPDPDKAYVAAGLYEEFLSKLATLQGLHVIARESAVQYSGDPRPIKAIAEELGVHMVMEGSLGYADERVAVSVRLRDGATGATVWSKRYNRPFAEVFDIRADIARNIANALAVEVTAADQTRIAAPLSQSPAAYALYLRALASFQSGFALEALELLNRALVVDPNLAAAFARKAEFHAVQGSHTKGNAAAVDELPPDAMALENADRALELDPESGRAWYARGLVHQRHWRWDDARSDFARAFKLGSIDLGAYAAFLLHSGDADRATELATQNVALNPNHAVALSWQGYVLARTGQLEPALAAYEKAARIAPMNAEIQRGIATVLLALGDAAGAEQALRASGQLLEEKQRARHLPWLAYMYARLGRTEDVQRLAHEYGAAQPNAMGGGEQVWLHLALGQTADAIAWLAGAVGQVEAERRLGNSETLMALKDNFPRDPVLEDPEFAKLRQRLQGLLAR